MIMFISNLSMQTDYFAVAHRGLSSLFPQNTLQALLAASAISQFIEFDVQLTKDFRLIIFHDRGLKRITNIADFPQFSDRKKTLTIDYYHEPVEDWWVRDFTLAELKQLSIRQSSPKRPNLHQHHFRILQFEEFLQAYFEYVGKQDSTLKRGLVIELKEEVADTMSQNDRVLCELLSTSLKKFDLDSSNKSQFPYVILQSFLIQLLDYMSTKNDLVLLYDKNIQITKELLEKHDRPNVIGIGITFQNFFGLNQDIHQRVRELCNDHNYQIFIWTLRDDEEEVPLGLENYERVYEKLRDSGVNGFITDFPQNFRKYLHGATVQPPTLPSLVTTLTIVCNSDADHQT